ncbi:RidA family protein [Candidatus Bathyarchaeota archaeon]|nr:RidA family protein [Candidatus Bathyarchaeota archaeon]
MKKTIVLDPSRRMPFASAVQAGDFIFCSGHAAVRDEAGNELTTIEEQTRQIMVNLQKTLAVANATLDDIVKLTVFLKDQSNFLKMNETYRNFFKSDLPARSTCIAGLVNPLMLLEIECIAYKPVIS